MLPHLNLTFNSLNVLLDLAEELVCPMEQRGALAGLCQVCRNADEHPSPWLARDLRLGGWLEERSGGGFANKKTNKE